MPVTPSGPVSTPLENLRVLIAASTGWQEWTEAEDADAAYERIHLVEMPAAAADDRTFTLDELRELRPCVIVDEFELPDDRPGGDAWVSDRHALGSFVESGRLLLRFEDGIQEEDSRNYGEAKIAFMNRVGAVLEGMKSLGGGDTEYLSLRRITRWEPFRRSSETAEATQGDYWSVSYVVQWGI